MVGVDRVVLGPKLENNPKSINPIFHHKKDHLRTNGTVIVIEMNMV